MGTSTKENGETIAKMVEVSISTTQLVINMRESGEQASVMAEVSTTSHMVTPTMGSKLSLSPLIHHSLKISSFQLGERE